MSNPYKKDIFGAKLLFSLISTKKKPKKSSVFLHFFAFLYKITRKLTLTPPPFEGLGALIGRLRHVFSCQTFNYR